MEIKSSVIKNDYVEIWIEEGIIIGAYKENLIIDIVIAKKMVNLRKELSAGVVRPILVDIRNLKSVTNEARDWMGRKEGQELLSAVAVLTNTPIQNLFANFYLKLSKPPIPTQLFTDKDKAIRWLRLYLQRN